MKWIRTVLVALLLSLVTGLVIGTIIRLRLEKPTRYIGAVGLPIPTHPGDVGHPAPPVLDPRQGEEQV